MGKELYDSIDFKGSYSIRDIKDVFRNNKKYRVGDVLYFRCDELINRLGKFFEIEIEFVVIDLINDTDLIVDIRKYWNGFTGEYVAGSDQSFIITSDEQRNVYRRPKYG